MSVTARLHVDGSGLVRQSMAAALDRLDADMRHVSGYHVGFWDAEGSPADAVGKGVRAALALLSARAAGGTAEQGVPAAVAVELIHNFSLLHDDVMDGDTQRRHRATAWTVFGSSPAILAGDALQSLAVEVLAEARTPNLSWAVRCLSAAVRRLIAGQVADLSFERRDDVGLEECLRMAGDKTGALLACSASLGTVLVDGPAELALGLGEFGAHLGLAFQLVDDLLGIWGEPAQTGKPVLSDLRSRKKSVPVVAALSSSTAPGQLLRRLYAQPDELSEQQLADAAELVERAGGRAWTERRADEELQAGLELLRVLPMPADVADEFATLARGLAHRDH